MAEICSTCGLPEELCMCEEMAREMQLVTVHQDTRRYGKVMTIIEGIDGADIDVEELARDLKKRTAAGGTVKDGNIELQGDHLEKVKKALEAMGFTVETR